MSKRSRNGRRERDDHQAGDEQPAGVRCPSCACAHCPVYYTREKLGHTMRVRECRHCGRRFTTREQVG